MNGGNYWIGVIYSFSEQICAWRKSSSLPIKRLTWAFFLMKNSLIFTPGSRRPETGSPIRRPPSSPVGPGQPHLQPHTQLQVRQECGSRVEPVTPMIPPFNLCRPHSGVSANPPHLGQHSSRDNCCFLSGRGHPWSHIFILADEMRPTS